MRALDAGAEEAGYERITEEGLGFKRKLIDMLLWGPSHPVTGQDVWPRTEKTGRVVTRFEDETERKVLRSLEVHASRGGTRFAWDVAEEEEDEETEAKVLELFMRRKKRLERNDAATGPELQSS